MNISSINEPIIGIDLGTTYSCVAIMRNGKVEIVPDNKTGEKSISSIVCFKSNSDCLIGKIAKYNMLHHPKSTMFDSKRLIGHKFNYFGVKEDIKNWHVKVIEEKKTGKSKYVIKIGKELQKNFYEDISLIILSLLKQMLNS